MSSNKNNNIKSGQNNVNSIYNNFLKSFGANITNSPQVIQSKFQNKLMNDFKKGNAENVIQNNLTKYVNTITQVQNALQKKSSNINQQKSNLNKQKSLQQQYRALLKQTNALLGKFDKYLLKYMSFIRTNPKRKKLLTDLANNMENIAVKYQYNLPVSGNTYTRNVETKVKTTQNTIMIEIIQAIIENTRPIYHEFKNNKRPINTNVSQNATKKILQNIQQTRLLGTALQKEFSKNISNWINLLTEIIELNAKTIILPSANSQIVADQLGEFYTDYQDAQTNINKLLAGNINNTRSLTSQLSNTKKQNDVFVQELVSEVFRWGLAIFKIYKHNQMVGDLPSPIETTN